MKQQRFKAPAEKRLSKDQRIALHRFRHFTDEPLYVWPGRIKVAQSWFSRQTFSEQDLAILSLSLLDECPETGRRWYSGSLAVQMVLGIPDWHTWYAKQQALVPDVETSQYLETET